MSKLKRVAPYKQKTKRHKQLLEKTTPETVQKKMVEVGIDVNNLKNKIDLMSSEQVALCKEIAAQNALKLFNSMLEQIQKRLPTMEDAVIVEALLNIWDKTGGKK